MCVACIASICILCSCSSCDISFFRSVVIVLSGHMVIIDSVPMPVFQLTWFFVGVFR